MSSDLLSSVQARREMKVQIGIVVTESFRWEARFATGLTRETCRLEFLVSVEWRSVCGETYPKHASLA